MRYYSSVGWTVEIVEEAVAELEELQPGLQARLVRLLEVVEAIGLENLREPHVKHIDGKLWELRAKAVEGIARGLYVTLSGRRVVVLHVFVKKSRKTPPRAIETARRRMRQVLQ
jgi:phage-related protein